MKSWKNAAGDLVIDDGTKLRVMKVRNADGTQTQNVRTDSLTQQVALDMAKPENAGIVCGVDETLGIVGAVLPPKGPNAANEDIGALRAAVDAAETAWRHAIVTRESGATVRRLELKLDTARRALHAAEHAKQIERLRQQGNL